MPITPYHFGPSGFIALILKRWIDLPVFLLANVVIDVEVLFSKGQFPHQTWHFHTFLVGALVGGLFGAAMFPMRKIFAKVMTLGGLSYKSGILTMIISGILGLWLHVIIDGFYHWDVEAFWPSRIKPLWMWASRWHISQGDIRLICLVFWVAAIVLYAGKLLAAGKKKNRVGDTK